MFAEDIVKDFTEAIEKMSNQGNDDGSGFGQPNRELIKKPKNDNSLEL